LQAPDWSPEAYTRLRQHYGRLLPFWPAERAFLPPADHQLQHTVIETLAPEAQHRLPEVVEEIRERAAERGQRIEATSRALLSLILAWALAFSAHH